MHRHEDLTLNSQYLCKKLDMAAHAYNPIAGERNTVV